MRRIDRYVLAQLLGVFGISALVLVLIYWVNRAVVLFDTLIADGQSAWVFLEFTALALPTIVRIVLPLAAFAATLMAMSRLTNDNELMVLRGSGLSPMRLARPILVFGLMVAALVSVLGHVLAPAAATRLGERQAEITATATARLLREGEFVSPVAGLTLYIRNVTQEGEIQGLLLSDSRDPTRTVTYTAERSYLVMGEGGPQLVMLEGLIQRLDVERDALVTTSFGDFAYDLGPILNAPTSGRRNSRELSTAELLWPTPALEEETRKSAGLLRAEAHDRFEEAILAPVATLIAYAALVVGHFSRLGLWRQTVGAVILLIAVKAVESVVRQAVRVNADLWLLTYLPAVLGFAIAGGLLWYANGGRVPWPRRATRAEA